MSFSVKNQIPDLSRQGQAQEFGNWTLVYGLLTFSIDWGWLRVTNWTTHDHKQQGLLKHFFEHVGLIRVHPLAVHKILETAQSPNSSFPFLFDFGLGLGTWTKACQKWMFKWPRQHDERRMPKRYETSRKKNLFPLLWRRFWILHKIPPVWGQRSTAKSAGEGNSAQRNGTRISSSRNTERLYVRPCVVNPYLSCLIRFYVWDYPQL